MSDQSNQVSQANQANQAQATNEVQKPGDRQDKKAVKPKVKSELIFKFIINLIGFTVKSH